MLCFSTKFHMHMKNKKYTTGHEVVHSYSFINYIHNLFYKKGFGGAGGGGKERNYYIRVSSSVQEYLANKYIFRCKNLLWGIEQ